MASLIDPPFGPSSPIEHSISWRAAIRRLFSIAPSSHHSRAGGMFDRAQNTNIHNATFTINHYGGVVVDHADTAGAAAEQRRNSGQGSSASSGHQEYDLLPSTRRESPDVYVDHLLTKNRGYPLWIPSPSTSLPILNRKLGVLPGDVGIFTPEGGFDYLFNIFHDSTHPINAVEGVPPGFIPFKAAVGPEFVEWNAGSYLADSSIIRVDDGGDPSKIILEATGPEAAVLMIPKEIRTARLRITILLRKYIEENIVSWYKFARHALGYDLENGGLQVVYGCRKSSGFGIATAFNTGRQANTRLTFSVNNDWVDISGCPYRWTHTGSAEVKAGPSQDENSEILLAEPVGNQCLFVNTINTKLSSEIWKKIVDLGIATTMDDVLDDPFISKQPRSESTRQSTGKSSTQGSTNPSSRQYNEAALHPSAILLDTLQTIIPGLAVYMTCDDDWHDFITTKVRLLKTNQFLPFDKDMNVHEFVTQVLKKRTILEHQGMAYFSGDDTQHLQHLSPNNESVSEIRFIRTKADNFNHTESYRWHAARTRLPLESLNADFTATSPSGPSFSLPIESGSLYESERLSLRDPSRSYSVITELSLPGVCTPSSLVSVLPYENVPLHVIEADINPLLRTNATGSSFRGINVTYPVSNTPGTYNYIPLDFLWQPATVPPVSSMSITIEKLPWSITVETKSSSRPFITIGDVFETVYLSLRRRASHEEFDMLPTKAAQDQVSLAFYTRCKRTRYEAEKVEGVKRIDFLLGHTHFSGLSAVKMGMGMKGWILELSSE